MKSESDFPRTNTRLPVRTASEHTQARIKRGRLPKGQLGVRARNHHQLERAVDSLVLMAVAGVGARQRAQHQEPRHEAEIGVRFAG